MSPFAAIIIMVETFVIFILMTMLMNLPPGLSKEKVSIEIVERTAHLAFDDGKQIGRDIVKNWRHSKNFDKSFDEWWEEHLKFLSSRRPE